MTPLCVHSPSRGCGAGADPVYGVRWLRLRLWDPSHCRQLQGESPAVARAEYGVPGLGARLGGDDPLAGSPQEAETHPELHYRSAWPFLFFSALGLAEVGIFASTAHELSYFVGGEITLWISLWSFLVPRSLESLFGSSGIICIHSSFLVGSYCGK